MKYKLSIIIPVFNEEKTVAELLTKVINAKISAEKEIIIINDGSTDTSEDLIENWREKNKHSVSVKYINKENGGKGSAVRKGIAISTGDAVIIQDADLEYDPADYEQCFTPIRNGECRIVYGSRELKANAKRVYSSPAFFLGGLLVTKWFNILFRSSLTDEPTCYKCFDGKLIRKLNFKGNKFDWEPEVTAKLLRLGFEIKEVPVSYHPRKVNEGKKIKWTDGVSALWTALYWRLLPINKIKKDYCS